MEEPPIVPMVHKWVWAARIDLAAQADADSPTSALDRGRYHPSVVGALCYTTPRPVTSPHLSEPLAQLAGEWWRSDTVRQALFRLPEEHREEREPPRWTSSGTLRWVFFFRGTPPRSGKSEHSQLHARDYVRLILRSKHPHRTVLAKCEVPFYQCPLADPGLIGAAVLAVGTSAFSAVRAPPCTWRWTERSVQSVAFVPAGEHDPHWSHVWPALQLHWWVHRVLARRDFDRDDPFEIHCSAQVWTADAPAGAEIGWFSRPRSSSVRWTCFGDPRWLRAVPSSTRSGSPQKMVGTDMLGPQAWYVHSLGRDAHYRAHQAPQYVMWVSNAQMDAEPEPTTLGEFYAWLRAWCEWPRVVRDAQARARGMEDLVETTMPDPAPLNLLDPHTFDRAYLVTCTHRRRPRVVGDQSGEAAKVVLPAPGWYLCREAESGTPAAYLPPVRSYAHSSASHPHVMWSETYDAPCCFHTDAADPSSTSSSSSNTAHGGAAYRYMKSTLCLGGGGGARGRAQGRIPDEWQTWAAEASGGRLPPPACRRYLGASIYECALALLRLQDQNLDPGRDRLRTHVGPGFAEAEAVLLGHPLAPSGPLHSWSFAELVGVWSAATGWSATVTRVESRPQSAWSYVPAVRPATDLAFPPGRDPSCSHVFLWHILDVKRNTRPLVEYQILEWATRSLSVPRGTAGAGLVALSVLRPWAWIFACAARAGIKYTWHVDRCWAPPGSTNAHALRVGMVNAAAGAISISGWIQVDPPCPWVAGAGHVVGGQLPSAAIWERGAWEAWCRMDGHPFSFASTIASSSTRIPSVVVHQVRWRGDEYTYTALVRTAAPMISGPFLTNRLAPVSFESAAPALGAFWTLSCWRALRAWVYGRGLAHLTRHVYMRADPTPLQPRPCIYAHTTQTRPVQACLGWGRELDSGLLTSSSFSPISPQVSIPVQPPSINIASASKVLSSPFAPDWPCARRRRAWDEWAAEVKAGRGVLVRPDVWSPGVLREMVRRGGRRADMHAVWDEMYAGEEAWVVPDMESAALIMLDLAESVLVYPAE